MAIISNLEKGKKRKWYFFDIHKSFANETLKI